MNYFPYQGLLRRRKKIPSQKVVVLISHLLLLYIKKTNKYYNNKFWSQLLMAVRVHQAKLPLFWHHPLLNFIWSISVICLIFIICTYVRPMYVLTYLGSIDRVHLRWAPMLISDLIMGILGKYLIQKTIKCFASQEIEKKRIFCCWFCPFILNVYFSNCFYLSLLAITWG